MPSAKTAARTFKGTIRVASTIVDYLSSGLYKTPAACLKELINNSFDADARVVNVFVKPDADRIVIEDDGTGLSREEFQRHFDRVSESFKREDGDKTPSGRRKIGKIGIGFIAANEICNRMEIISTKRGSRDRLHVSIDFAEMRKSAAARRDKSGGVAKADYEGIVERADAKSHFTYLFLSEIRGEAKRILASAHRQHGDAAAFSLYGLKPKGVAELLRDPKIENWDQLDAYSKSVLDIGLNVPVQYLPNWAPQRWMPKLRSFANETQALAFKVLVDGAELRKPVMFRDPEKSVCEVFKHSGKAVAARGYFYAQRRSLKPEDLQGLLVRIRHAAVGEYDRTFWNFPSDEGRVFQSWISAEIWADDRLEDAMNIDRRTLRDTHPAYVELQAAIHEFLSRFIHRARQELYDKPAEERQGRRAAKELASIQGVVADYASLTPRLRQSISRQWTSARDARGQRRLIKRYSVAALYRIVLSVADEVLSKADASRFVEELTRRLRR